MSLGIPRRTPVVMTLPALALGLGVGCGEPSGSSTTTVTDSAGIAVVTNLEGALDAAETWTLATTPEIEIGGGTDPDVPLYRVGGILPLGGDRIAVASNGPSRVVIVGGDGRAIAELGRAGDGPGEFSSVGSIVPFPGDSLAVWDPDRRRLSVFSRGGAFGRSVDLTDLVPVSPLAAPSTEVPAAFTALHPVGEDAWIAFPVGVWGPGGGDGVFRVEMPAVRIDAEGREVTRYGPFPGLEMYNAPGLGWAPYPFARTTYGAVSGDRLVVGTADVHELRYYGPDGRLERIVRWSAPLRPLADSPESAAFEAWLDELLAPREPAEREMVHGMLDAMEPPEHLPAHGALVSDRATGEIWVGAYPGQLGLMGLTEERRRLPARRWLVFGPAGELVATAEIPEGFEPRIVEDGRIWGIHTDELDVESVRAYVIR